MAADPWFSSWNYGFLRALFNFIPHGRITDECSEHLLVNPLLSTWIFAFCFYRFWMKDDERRAWRRRYLTRTAIAVAIAGLITVFLRPWVHWPAPVLNPNYQGLFPQYLWGNGNGNCFPSHSTLAYFTIAVGFWPLNRRLSLLLSAMALLFISFPRVYEGGHYPIDVLFSCLLGIFVLLIIWSWPLVTDSTPPHKPSGGAFRDLIFFLWVFEVGEGFHGLESLTSMVHHAITWW